MERYTWKRGLLSVLAVTLLSMNAAALFGWGKQSTAIPGAPEAEPLSCATYQGVSCWGQLKGQGGTGAAQTFSVVDAPKKGAVSVEGDCFVYTPKETAFGTDRFTYAVTDGAGNVSKPAEVRVDIERTRSEVTYCDMADSTAAVAAQYLAEEGVFVGSKLGEQYYFEPEREVLRSEFLAMTLELLGRDVTEVTMTGFCDDEVIPTWAKAYAAAGVAEGLVKGAVTEAGSAFRGEEPITFNEAATVLDRMLRMENVDLQVWYADREAVPSWAAQAVANLESVQVLAAGSFGSATMAEPICREDAARMLAAAGTLLEK